MTPKTLLSWLLLSRKRQRERMAADLGLNTMASRGKPDAVQSHIKKLME